MAVIHFNQYYHCLWIFVHHSLFWPSTYTNCIQVDCDNVWPLFGFLSALTCDLYQTASMVTWIKFDLHYYLPFFNFWHFLHHCWLWCTSTYIMVTCELLFYIFSCNFLPTQTASMLIVIMFDLHISYCNLQLTPNYLNVDCYNIWPKAHTKLRQSSLEQSLNFTTTSRSLMFANTCITVGYNEFWPTSSLPIACRSLIFMSLQISSCINCACIGHNDIKSTIFLR